MFKKLSNVAVLTADCALFSVTYMCLSVTTCRGGFGDSWWPLSVWVRLMNPAIISGVAVSGAAAERGRRGGRRVRRESVLRPHARGVPQPTPVRPLPGRLARRTATAAGRRRQAAPAGPAAAAGRPACARRLVSGAGTPSQ